ncbi:hypothetical protein BST95_10640 [Halioglobus japonicus]|uniref:Sulfatase N-terminal domain-containing protein n=1 Tax=Halioglobus japonicus TaxID=930805 RepID=A0AAP8MF48_9GAMM|nr:sulfatase-like hydrolase/transferase [Halioglobus japonicus]AQA18628.1 hypothetical protein BST95_10640 [Halioglobus japonicus]PLW86652.1 hypothetical protein C0029_09665 [Halioglobus japonicus]GHD11757.1 hypothetical protein GCM10007052_11860 [Halioglobus japonicus]
MIAAANAEDQRPDILIVLADDMGWADSGAFDSEIKTPSINSIAADGVRFTNFYTNPMCAPTQVTLMSGVDHHVLGGGAFYILTAPNQQGQPGCVGYLRPELKTLGDMMRGAGYGQMLNWRPDTPTARSTATRNPVTWPSSVRTQASYLSKQT